VGSVYFGLGHYLGTPPKLSGSDRYYVELTRQGKPSCTTSNFAMQSAAQDWIDQDREREGALDRRWQVASRRWPWWMHLWWRA
jgi:hypothetical protein